MKFLLARKLGMTTIYSDAGADNVTLLEVEKNVVTTLRTEEKDGYTAVQVGLVDEKKSEKAKKEVYSHVREFRVDDVAAYEVGKQLEVSQFEAGEKITVQGISKGKGYQGVVKRWGFAGSPASHGHRHDLRAPGSIGSAFPEKVFKGKKMAGRMGTDSVTTKNVKVSLVDAEKNIIAVKGAVPGNIGGVIEVTIK